MRPIETFLFAATMISCLILPAISARADLIREDFFVKSENDLRLFVRKVSDPAPPSKRGPFLLIHGARVGSIASFDVDVPGYSLAADLAAAGHSVYLADLRGYGRSDFPATMEGDRFSGPLAVPTGAAVTDVKAVFDEIARRHPGQPVSAMGWATGSHWLAATEAANPGSIARLIVYNSVYGGKGAWKLTKIFARDGAPSEFDYAKFGAYRLSDAASLVGRWTKAKSISQSFVDRYVALAMEGDPTARLRTPPSFRHPSGPIADTLQAVHKGRLYDAGTIRSDVLILRSGNDFWSRPVDVTTLRNDLKTAASVTVHEMPGVSHYVHFEPGEARNRLIGHILDFAEDGVLNQRDPS